MAGLTTDSLPAFFPAWSVDSFRFSGLVDGAVPRLALSFSAATVSGAGGRAGGEDVGLGTKSTDARFFPASAASFLARAVSSAFTAGGLRSESNEWPKGIKKTG